MSFKSKFDKRRCRACKYHGKMTGLDTVPVFCNYASLKDDTCLESDGIYNSRDRRGDDFNNCLLFEKGSKVRDGANWQENHMSGLRNLGGVKCEK